MEIAPRPNIFYAYVKDHTHKTKTPMTNPPMTTLPVRYLPPQLSRSDAKKQFRMLTKSKKLYKKGKYFTRDKVGTYKHKPSKHVVLARKIYHIDNISLTPKLAKASGCSLSALRQIVSKGEGAYFSSGSRPNQTAQSWGLARLASALTGGKAAAVDYHILAKGCDAKGKAFRLAQTSVKKYNHGQSKTRKVRVVS
jgi:hypothetical protein